MPLSKFNKTVVSMSRSPIVVPDIKIKHRGWKIYSSKNIVDHAD